MFITSVMLHSGTISLVPGSHDDVIKWKHFPRYLPFVRGIHRSPVNSLHRGQLRGALVFSFICVWINGWVNNGDAGELRRHRAHYEVTIMTNPDSKVHRATMGPRSRADRTQVSPMLAPGAWTLLPVWRNFQKVAKIKWKMSSLWYFLSLITVEVFCYKWSMIRWFYFHVCGPVTLHGTFSYVFIALY